jgi:hypothetical protein
MSGMRRKPSVRTGLALTGLILVVTGCGIGATSKAKVGAQGSHLGQSTTTVASKPSGSQTSTPGSTSTTTPPTMLASGQTGSLTNVPWSLVGPGWVLATWSTAIPSAATTPPATIYLVDPQGGRYSMGTSPAGSVLSDWSGDGTKAAFEVQSGTGATIYVIDFQTGSTTHFPIADGDYSPGIEFTRPDGLAVIVGGANTQSGPMPTQRYSLTGVLQESYPTSFPQAGTAIGAVAESPDGTQLVLGTQNGLELVSNSGQSISFLAPPSGQQPCFLVRWWGGGDVLINCESGMWIQPVSGAAPTAITNSSAGDTVINAWPLPSGDYAEGAACGTTWLDKVNANGSTTRLNPPGTPVGDSVSALGVYQSRLVIQMTPSCDMPANSRPTSNTLGYYDPVGNVVTPLLGAGANGGWIDQAVLYKDGVLS